MHKRKPKCASMKGIRHDAYKANKVDYTTPIKTKDGMTQPTKIRVITWHNSPKNPLRWHPKDLSIEACTMIHS